MNTLGLDYGSSSPSDDEHDDVKPIQSIRNNGRNDGDDEGEEDNEELELLRAGIPPEQTVGVSAVENDQAQERIRNLLSQTGEPGSESFQKTLSTKKEVRNPYILEKVVEYFGIDELHSNFSASMFDPHGLPLHEYTDSIALAQKQLQDKREQQQLERRQEQQLSYLQFVGAKTSQ